MAERPVLVSLVFRISKRKRNAIRALSRRTRIGFSVYVREGLRDLLRKYDQEPRVEPESHRNGARSAIDG